MKYTLEVVDGGREVPQVEFKKMQGDDFKEVAEAWFTFLQNEIPYASYRELRELLNADDM